MLNPIRTYSNNDIESKYIKYVIGGYYEGNILSKINLDTFKQEDYVLEIDESISKRMSTCVLPNDELFCYGNIADTEEEGSQLTGITFIIKQNNEIQLCKSGVESSGSCLVYHDGIIYVFGGVSKSSDTRCFIISKNKGINLPKPTHWTSDVDCIEFQQKIIIINYIGQHYVYDIFNSSYSEILEVCKDKRNKFVCKGNDRAYVIDPVGYVYESERCNPFVWYIVCSSVAPNRMYIESLCHVVYKGRIFFRLDADIFEFNLERKEMGFFMRIIIN